MRCDRGSHGSQAMTPTAVCDRGRAAEAGHCEGITIVLCLAVPVVVRACSQGLSDSQGKDRGRVGKSLPHPEKGHVVISCGDEQVAERVEYKHSDRMLSRVLERMSCKWGFVVLVLIAQVQATQRVMLVKWQWQERTMMEKLGKLV